MLINLLKEVILFRTKLNENKKLNQARPKEVTKKETVVDCVCETWFLFNFGFITFHIKKIQRLKMKDKK